MYRREIALELLRRSLPRSSLVLVQALIWSSLASWNGG